MLAPTTSSVTNTMVAGSTNDTIAEAECQFESNYDMERAQVLGEGTFGRVHRARCLATGEWVAMKHIKLANEDEGVPSTAIREIAILKTLCHDNVVRLYDQFCSTSKVVLVFECLDNDLKKFMKQHNCKLSPSVIKNFSLQLMKGIDFCHSRRIMHRDLKPQNLLIGKAMNLKIADFGLARAFMLPVPKYTHEVVTVWYRPPEILLGSPLYSIHVDQWGVGCIIAEMATGAPLFAGDCEIDTVFKIFQKLGTPTEAMWPGLLDLPDFKPTFPTWKAKGWANIRNTAAQVGTDGLDLLDQLMQYHPMARMSARKALHHNYFAEVERVILAKMGGA